MQMPALYHKAHKQFKLETGLLVRKYLEKFRWHNDGSEILMDVGHGPGDFFMDFIYPQVPKNFEKIICADMLPEMLEHSREFYKNPKKFEYRLFDLRTNEELPSDLKGKIHHLTAINLLHWVKEAERGRVLKNVYDLLHAVGGECLILFVPFITTFDVYDNIIKSPKWCPYLQNIEEYLPTSNYSSDVINNFRSMLEEVGFTNIAVEENTSIYTYNNFDTLKEGLAPVCAVLKYIPESLRSEFMDDFIGMVVDLFSIDADVAGSKYGLKCKFIVAHARKLSK